MEVLFLEHSVSIIISWLQITAIMLWQINVRIHEMCVQMWIYHTETESFKSERVSTAFYFFPFEVLNALFHLGSWSFLIWNGLMAVKDMSQCLDS